MKLLVYLFSLGNSDRAGIYLFFSAYLCFMCFGYENLSNLDYFCVTLRSIWIDRSRYFPPIHCIISFPTLRNQTFLIGQERRLRAVSGISSQEQSHRVWLTLLMSSKYKYAVHFLRLADKAWHFPAVQEDSQTRGQAASSRWDCRS